MKKVAIAFMALSLMAVVFVSCNSGVQSSQASDSAHVPADTVGVPADTVLVDTVKVVADSVAH